MDYTEQARLLLPKKKSASGKGWENVCLTDREYGFNQALEECIPVVAQFEELKERNDWFDNLVEYKVKGKYASLKDYVESLEQRIAELKKALNGLMNEVFSGQASMSSYGYKQSQQALSKEKE